MPFTIAFRLFKQSFFLSILFAFLFFSSCKEQEEPVEQHIKEMNPVGTDSLAKTIESIVKPELADNLTLKLWGVDSLVISPIALDIDDSGKVYYVTTNRQKNSEFDIRGHKDWEIASIQLQTVEDKRAFLHKILSPENSKKNEWLADVNGDSSHDWRDMTVEKENVYKMEDVNGDGVADRTQLIVDDFHDEVTDVAGGLLVNGKDLFLAVGPDLWRMEDKNGDGIEDEKTSISHGYGVHIGFGGHGMSGVEMGPDGRIYWQIGDIGFSGTDKEGKKWDHPNSGVIARSNPDGSDFEIFASGNRNTHEFAFDEYGNLISEDNDGDHPGEKERLVYVVNGADIGWRSNWQYGKYNDPDNNTYKVWMAENLWKPRFDGQAAYITPCIDNFVSGPAGFLYNPGTALSPKYNNTFFVAEFVGNPAQSGIYSFKLNPKGATFTLGENKKILSGVLATGMDFGPDGAMYIADWIDGWGTHNYGRIWKLDDKDAASLPQRIETKKLLAEDFTKSSEDELGNILKSPDLRVRMKAQFELVNRKEKGAEIFKRTLAQRDNQLARVNSIWGISQLARQDKKYGTLLIPLLQDADQEIRAQAAKWMGDIKYKEAGKDLQPLLKDSYSRARFFAAEALGRIAYEPAIPAIIDMLRANNDEDAYLRHAGSLALARIGKSAPIVALANDTSRALRIAAVVALRRMSNAGIARFLNDSDEYVVTEAARGINDDLSIKDALPALGNLLKTTHYTNEALIRRCINANLRTGSDEAMQNLINYSSATTNPPAMRAEAIAALSTWAKPSVLDRVDGRSRGVVQRDVQTVKNKAGDVLTKLLNDKASDVRLSAVKAVARLDLKQAGSTLLALLKNDQSPEVKVASLKALAGMNDTNIEQAIQVALNGKDKAVRVAGIDLVSKLNIPKPLMVKLLAGVINNQPVEEKQAALLTLGSLPVENTKDVLDGLLTQMNNGKLSPDIYFELGAAVDSSRSPQLIAKYKEAASKLSKDELTASFAGSLYGGDPGNGRVIFFSNQSAQCMRCHSYNDMGGNAGPRLNGIASRIPREKILEALINPSARLAPGYGVVTLELKNGKTISGVLMEEKDKSLSIKKGEQQDTTILKDQVAKRTNAASSMPEMRYILSKKEIRDVVSFVSTLK
ncbi:MAG: HEAT repeat domain-containing protein [Ginsengibacter sp.]